ncbi:NAD(+) synthase, partial [Bacteroidota bacterium]
IGITVCIGLPIRKDGSLYNCAMVLSDQKISGIYAKQFLANDGVHYEPRWFTAWTQGELHKLVVDGEEANFGDVTININGINIGFEICEDAWRSDRPANRLIDKNIQLILNPSASHFAMGKTDQRQNLVIDSSRKFNCAYLYINLLGNEAGRMIYDGEVLIASKGKWLGYNGNLSYQDYNLIIGSVDFESWEGEFITPPETFNINEEFAQATSLGLFDYLRKSRNKGFVVSLSGGADSSCCAILVSEMVRRGLHELGPEEFVERIGRHDLLSDIPSLNENKLPLFFVSQILTCVYQGTKNSSRETLDSAIAVAESIGATFYKWEIDGEVKSYTEKIEKALNRSLTWDQDDVALQNIQARARSPVVWMLANIKNAILLTTSNRSEGDLGYATMDGDTSGSLAPIAAVDKHFILNWLRWAEKSLSYDALNNVNKLDPSAELRPPEKGQTDEKDLMPYRVIVEIEKLAIREHMSPLQVYMELREKDIEHEDLLKQHVTKFFRLWSFNQWKRERTAPAFHLDDFNVDPRTWCRFPILTHAFKEELRELEELD